MWLAEDANDATRIGDAKAFEGVVVITKLFAQRFVALPIGEALLLEYLHVDKFGGHHGLADVERARDLLRVRAAGKGDRYPELARQASTSLSEYHTRPRRQRQGGPSSCERMFIKVLGESPSTYAAARASHSPLTRTRNPAALSSRAIAATSSSVRPSASVIFIPPAS